jgi:subtilase family serine protease
MRRRLWGCILAMTASVSLLTGAVSATAQAAPSQPSYQPLCAAATVGRMSCFALMRTDLPSTARLAPGQAPAGLSPADLQSAYKLPSSTRGAGATVAIVDAYDNPNAEADLAVYRRQFGLPACTTANGCFRKVNENGLAAPLPTTDTGWGAEISLDLDMVSAVCPNCHILLVEATDALTFNLFSGVDTAVSLGAKYVSNSYGGAEGLLDPVFDSLYFDHPGVAITASSGDSGYGVIYPASSPFVTAVGGTSLTRDGSARGWSESAWSGAGSGCSIVESKPAWQPASTGCAYRAVADVSAVADPKTGLAVYDTFGYPGWKVFGGTSASSPIVASVYALAGAPGAGDRPAAYPYAHPSGLFDVTTGSNGTCGTELCNAGPGWDGPTGLGTPNGTTAFAP